MVHAVPQCAQDRRLRWAFRVQQGGSYGCLSPSPVSSTSTPPAPPPAPESRRGLARPWLALYIVVALALLLAAGAAPELLYGPYDVRFAKPYDYATNLGLVTLVVVPAAGVVCPFALRSLWALLAAPVFVIVGAIAGGWLMGAPWYDAFSEGGNIWSINATLLLLLALVDVPAGLVLWLRAIERRDRRARANAATASWLREGAAGQGAGQGTAQRATLTAVSAASRRPRVTLWQGLLLVASAALLLGLAVGLAVQPPGPLARTNTPHQVGEPVIVDNNTLRVTIANVYRNRATDPTVGLQPGVVVDVTIENLTDQPREAYVRDALLLRDNSWGPLGFGIASEWRDDPPVVTRGGDLPPKSLAYARVRFRQVPAWMNITLELQTRQGRHIYWYITT
jgi:hypothetical protein